LKKTLKDYFQVLFGTGFARGIALLNSIIIARLLGPKEFGKFSIFYTVLILTWQLPQAFDTTFVRYAKTSNSHSEKNNYLKASVLIKLLYSISMLSISYPLAYFLSEYIFLKPEIKLILLVAFVSGLFLSFLMTIASTFQEKEQFGKYAFLYSIYTVSIFCSLLMFKTLNLNLSLWKAISIYVLVSLTIGAMSIRILTSKVGRLSSLDTNVLKTSFSLGKWILGATFILFLFLRLDVLFLTRYVDFEAVGIYSVAVQLIMVVSVMTGSFSGVFLPKASGAMASKSSLKLYIKESLLAILLINTFFAAFIIAAPFIIRSLYGIEYLPAGSILRILSIGWMSYIIYLPFSFLFYTLNDAKTPFLFEFLKLCVGIGLLYYLVPLKSIYGAAFAICIALVLHAVASLIIISRKIHVELHHG
jgi:O-antigen/teichoic acid export membrane protein